MELLLKFVFMCTVHSVYSVTHRVTSLAYFHTYDKSLQVIPSDIPEGILGLYLKDNNISYIAADDLISLSKLEFLTLPNNVVKLFPNLTHVADTLKGLHLAGNLISFIPGMLLNMLKTLEILIVSDNRLQHFPDVPGPADTLTTLEISGNSFNNMPTVHVIGSSLTKLKMESVPVTCDRSLLWILNIPDVSGTCSGPGSLNGTRLETLTKTHLGLPGSTIRKNNTGLLRVPSEVIPSNCSDLDLRNNHISEIVSEDFKNISHLYDLKLKNNSIKIFPNLSYIADNLAYLDLSLNIIEAIPPALLNLLMHLQSLNMKCNKLKYFPNVSGPSKTLHELDLSENQFTTFPTLSDIGQNLENLYLYGNSIHKIALENFVVKRNVQSKMCIHLASNKLSTVPLIAGPFMEHFSLYVYDNPLVCDYKLSWLMARSKSYIDGHCIEPVATQDREIRDITVDELLPLVEDSRSKRATSGHLLSKNMYSTTLPIQKYHSQSLIECMTKCASTAGCMYINYRHHYTVTGPYNCHIGSALSSGGQWYHQMPDDGQGWSYYAV